MIEARSAPTLDAAILQDFQVGFRGEVIVPGDEDHEAARRIWKGRIDTRSALIARYQCPPTSRSAAMPPRRRKEVHSASGTERVTQS